MKEPTLFYKIEGLVQNRRDFAESYSYDMLRGKYVSKEEMKVCNPALYYDDRPADNNILIPCGLLAHNVFTDSFSVIDSSGEKLEFSEESIALNVDRTQLYKPPHENYANASHWLETSGIFPEGQTNEHFMVWMRRSPFTPFRKVYALMHNEKVLKAGNYTMSIRNFYAPGNSSITKYFVISEWSKGVMGGSGQVAMAVFGCLALFFFAGAGALGILGYRRTLPNSPYNPINLREITEENHELMEFLS